MVIGARQLPYLKELVHDLMRKGIPLQYYHRRTGPAPAWLGLIHDLWCAAWPLKPPLAFQARARLEERAHLDAAQFAVLSAARFYFITVSPIGRLALERLRAKGFDRPERYEPEFWNGVTRQAAHAKSLWKACRFDTVIVDEAQDFGADEWRIADRCCGRSVLRRKRLWVLFDESQAFWADRALPRPFLKKCARLNLDKPYRWPPGIQALADAYKSKFMHRTELGGHPIVQATDDRAHENIVCDTFLRYKGLERLAVILTDLRRDSDRYAVRITIAISRAVGILRIAGTREEIERDETLAGSIHPG